MHNVTEPIFAIGDTRDSGMAWQKGEYELPADRGIYDAFMDDRNKAIMNRNHRGDSFPVLHDYKLRIRAMQDDDLPEGHALRDAL